MIKIYLTTFTAFVLIFSVAFGQSGMNNQEPSKPDNKGVTAISNTLDFDGFEDYVGIANGTALIAGLEEFSMCGWVYPTNANAAWPDFDGFFGIKNEGVCDFYVAQINGIGIEARIRTGDGIYTINPVDVSEVTLDEWHHYGLVYTGSELQLYLDGTLDGTVAATGTIDYSTYELTIGKLVFGTAHFYLDGKVDEVTIWDKALTEEEVELNMCISGDPSGIDGLVAYYDFNEESGLVLPDYFEGYDGALSGMTGDEWVSSDVCTSGFDITFLVIDEETALPLEGVEIDLDGIIKLTDSDGEAVFSNYDPGVYNWEAGKFEYYAASGEVEVIDEDILVEIDLVPIQKYDVTFVVTDDLTGDPIDNAIVNLDGLLHYTEEDGTTTFTNYLPGTYIFNVSKTDYILYSGEVEVVDADVTVEVSLEGVPTYSITFVVTEEPGSNPIENATIDLDEVVQYTDESGTTTFDGYLPGEYPYTVSKEGYYFEPGVAEVIEEDLTINITLLIDGLGEIAEQNLRIYPNPATDLLYIDLLENKTEPVTAELFNMAGEVILSAQIGNGINTINLENIEHGLYLIKVSSGEKQRVSQLIIR